MVTDRVRVVSLAAAVLAVAALAVIGVFYSASGLIAPLWAVITLMAIWAGLVFLAIRWFRRYPWRVVLLPFVAVFVWVAVVSLGERLLGWTA